MTTEKRKHTPIEPPSPPQDQSLVDAMPLRTRRPMPVLAQRKRPSTQHVPQDNINPIRQQKTVFRRLGNRDHTMPQPPIVKKRITPQQPEACRNFQRHGHCKYGDKCIYLHQLPSSSDTLEEHTEQKVHPTGLRITQTTNPSPEKRSKKSDSQSSRKVVLEDIAGDTTASKTQPNTSTSAERKEFDEALLLERRRQEIKLELQRLEAEPKQKEQMTFTIQPTTVKSSTSEGEASSSSSEEESSDEQSDNNDQIADDDTVPSVQPRSAVVVPHDRPSRTSDREQRRPRSIVTPVLNTSRTLSKERTAASRSTSKKDRKRTSDEARVDTTRSGRQLVNERPTTSQVNRPRSTQSKRDAPRPVSIRGPPLQSQEEQYRERRNEPLPTHREKQRQPDGRRLPQRQDSSASLTASHTSAQPTNRSSRSRHTARLPADVPDRSATATRDRKDLPRSHERVKQSQHKNADSRTRESTNSLLSTRKEKERKPMVGADGTFAPRRNDEVRRNQYLSEVDERVASASIPEFSRQDSNSRHSARPKQFTEQFTTSTSAQSQRPQDHLATLTNYSHKSNHTSLSRRTTNTIENLTSKQSTEQHQRSDRPKAKESQSNKRSYDQLTVEEATWKSKPQSEPPHKRAHREWSVTSETKVHEDSTGGTKAQATVTIHDTEFAVDAISDDEEEAAVDQTVEQVTDEASDLKEQVSDTDTPPPETPTKEPAPDVGDGERVTKERKKFASYGGGSTGSIDERALPEAEELEDISDDEIGDTSSISSAVHGGRHKLSAADWASLIEPKQSSEKAPSSARQRFAPQNFLRTCAISSKHIPTALVTQIEQMCNMKAEQEDGSVAAPKTAFHFLADSGAEHIARMREAEALASSYQLVGTHRRALCARDDLRFRRRLCGYGPELEDPSTASEQGMPFVSQLFEKSKQLFVDQLKIVA